MNITPVTATIVDWEKLVKTINTVTGRSPTRLLDSSNFKVGDLSSFVSSIAYFCCEMSPFQAFQFSPTIYKHVTFGFLVEITEKQYHAICRETDLFCSDNYKSGDDEKLVLISGNLIQWKNATVIFCDESQPAKLRTLFNAFYTYFVNQNFSELFASHSKKELDGNSFILEEQ